MKNLELVKVMCSQYGFELGATHDGLVVYSSLFVMGAACHVPFLDSNCFYQKLLKAIALQQEKLCFGCLEDEEAEFAEGNQN